MSDRQNPICPETGVPVLHCLKFYNCGRDHEDDRPERPEREEGSGFASDYSVLRE